MAITLVFIPGSNDGWHVDCQIAGSINDGKYIDGTYGIVVVNITFMVKTLHRTIQNDRVEKC